MGIGKIQIRPRLQDQRAKKGHQANAEQILTLKEKTKKMNLEV